VTRRVASSALSTARSAPATALESHTGAWPVLFSAATAWLTLTAYRRIAERQPQQLAQQLPVRGL